jgi:hypothetical protein
MGSADRVKQGWVPPIVRLRLSDVTIFLGANMSMGVRRRSADRTADGRNGIGVEGFVSDMIMAPVVELETVAE